MRLARMLIVLMCIAMVGSPETLSSSIVNSSEPRRVFTLDLEASVRAAQAAASHCLAKGYSITVLVVDSAGVPVVMLSGEDANERSQADAASKAAEAIRFSVLDHRGPSHVKVDESAASEGKIIKPTAMLPKGAVLLKDYFGILGAISVAGASSEQDELCVEAGEASFQWADWQRQDIEFFFFNPLREQWVK